MRVNRKQLYTESIGCNIASDSASPKSSQPQTYANQYVFLPHYPDTLVNYPFEILTALSYYRITTRIGIYTKNPCQLSLRTIDLSFGIQNQYESVVTYPKELSTYPFECLTANSDSESLTFVSVAKKSHPMTPSSGNMEPLQWKLGLTPPVEISNLLTNHPRSGNTERKSHGRDWQENYLQRSLNHPSVLCRE